MAKTATKLAAGPAGDAAGGLRKSAILMISLDKPTATSIMAKLSPSVVEDLTREIAMLNGVTEEQRRKVIEEFHGLALAETYTEEGGLAYARSLLSHSLPEDKVNQLMRQIESQFYSQPFSFLNKTEAENLLTFIMDEHPQTIALILAHLPAEKASEILAGLPQEKQIEVVQRISRMEQTSPEVIKDVEQGLERRLSGILNDRLQRTGGVETVAAILNLADRATEKAILDQMAAEDPELVDRIRRLMFVFEDILLVNDKGIQATLKEIENADLILSLRTASEELKQKIFGNMSDRAVQMIKEEMEYMGPVRLSDVELAQQRIVDVVRRLEEAGEIILAGRGGESELVV